jgi:hypothetical protein
MNPAVTAYLDLHEQEGLELRVSSVPVDGRQVALRELSSRTRAHRAAVNDQ